MKKYLTLHNVILCCAAFVGLLFFGLSFAAKASASVQGVSYVFNGSVWGSFSLTLEGGTTSINQALNVHSLFPLPMIGFILLLVGTLAALCGGLLVKDEKIKKIVLLSCAGLVLVGGVFQFFNTENVYYAFQAAFAEDFATVERVKQLFAESGAKVSGGALCIISGIFSILAAGGIALVPFIKDKALTK